MDAQLDAQDADLSPAEVNTEFDVLEHLETSQVAEAFSADAFEAQLDAQDADLSPVEVNTAFEVEAPLEASQEPDAF